MKLSAFLLIFTLLVAVVLARDPCPDAAKGTILRHDVAARCLRGLELPSPVKKAAIDSIRKLIDVYIFEPMLKNPPTEFQDSYTDLYARLDEIAAKPHTNDYDLQMDLRRMMASARDLHSTWHASTYTQVFLRAFPFAFVPRSNPLAKHGFEFVLVQLPMVDLDQYNAVTGLGLDLNKIQAQPVTSINGMEPFDFVGKWADEHIGARTPRQRLLMAAYGGFSLGLMGSDFTEPAMTYEIGIENGHDFTMQSIAVLETDIHGIQTLEQISPLNPFFQEEKHSFALEKEAHLETGDEFTRFVHRTFGDFHRMGKPEPTATLLNNHLESLHKGPDMELLYHSSSKTCFWKLDTYAPEGPGMPITTWVKDMLAIEDLISEKRCDTDGHVILDLRANGGGMVTLASSLWSTFLGTNLWPQINSRIRYRDNATSKRLHREVEWNETTATEYEMKPYDSYAIKPEYVPELKEQLTPVSWYRDQIFNPLNKQMIIQQLEDDYSLPEDIREAFLIILKEVVDAPARIQLDNQNFAVLVGAMSASCSAFTSTRLYDGSFAKIIDVGPRNERFSSNQLALVPGSDTVGIDQILDDDFLRQLPRGASASFGNMGSFPIFRGMGRKLWEGDSDSYTYAFTKRESHFTLTNIMNTALPIDGAFAGSDGDIINVLNSFDENSIWDRCFENQYTDHHEVNGAVIGRKCDPKTGKFTEKEEFLRCTYSHAPTGKTKNGFPTCKKIDIFYIRRAAFATAGVAAGAGVAVLLAVAAVVVGVQRSRKTVGYTAI